MDWLRIILRADGVANLAIGAGIALAARPLASALGVETVWPLYVLAAGLAVYGVDQWITARRPSIGVVTVFAVVDIAFGLGSLLLAGFDPTGAETWLRWGMAVLGVVVIGIGIAKTAFRHQAGPDVIVPGTRGEPA